MGLSLKKSQITLSPCFTFIPKTGVGLPKAVINFYCMCLKMAEIFQLLVVQFKN